MRRIPLTQGQFAIVDDEDFERINALKWCAAWDQDPKSFYAIRSSPKIDGKRLTIRMHREILDAPRGISVDHINHDTLDNRRENLRVCTMQQNMANVSVRADNKSGLKGVAWHKQNKKWLARIRVNGKLKHIGYFSTAFDAALAYDAEAIIQFGKFALTNRMLGLIQ